MGAPGSNVTQGNRIAPYGTDRVGGVSQAFHAWLPSFSPFGTKASLTLCPRKLPITPSLRDYQ
jgi:hypothetical protein